MTTHLRVQSSTLTVCVLLLAGCVGTTQPTWLPDSSGFVMSREDGELIHYDLKRDAVRKLAPAFEGYFGRTAVSPDGILIALASAKIGKDYLSITIETRRLSSGDQLTEKFAEWGSDRTGVQKTVTNCYWSTDRKHILICCRTIDPVAPPRFAVYNFASDRLQQLDAPPPAYRFCAGIGISPNVPDGTGYLSVENIEGFSYFRLVDWDGHVKPVVMTDEALAKLKELRAQTADEAQADPQPPVPYGQWEGNQATFYTRQGIFVLDAAARKMSLEPLSPAQSRYWESLDQSAPEGDDWKPMHIVRFRDSPNEIRCWRRTIEEGGYQVKFELVNRRTYKRRVLLEATSAGRSWEHPFTLSPNGKSAFLRKTDKDTTWFYVFDHEGNQLGRIFGGEIPR